MVGEQFTILPISEHYNEYAKEVSKLLKNYDIRGLVDERNEKIGRKIRDAELQKTPYMLIVGEKEAKENRVSVRQQAKGDIGQFTVEQFSKLIQEQIDENIAQFN